MWPRRPDCKRSKLSFNRPLPKTLVPNLTAQQVQGPPSRRNQSQGRSLHSELRLECAMEIKSQHKKQRQTSRLLSRRRYPSLPKSVDAPCNVRHGTQNQLKYSSAATRKRSKRYKHHSVLSYGRRRDKSWTLYNQRKPSKYWSSCNSSKVNSLL